MSKKLSAVLIACLVACLSTGCGSDKSDKKDVRATSGEKTVEQNAQKKEAPNSKQEKITIEDVQKFAVPQKYRAPSFGLSFKVTNNTDKPISGIQLNITVKSQFGDRLRDLVCDINQDIPAGGTILFNKSRNYSWDTNQFINNEVNALETPADKLRFDFDVSKIVYKDGTID